MRVATTLLFLLLTPAVMLAQSIGGAVANSELTQIWGSVKLVKGFTLEPQFAHAKHEAESEHHGKTVIHKETMSLGDVRLGKNFHFGEDRVLNLSAGVATNGERAGFSGGERLDIGFARAWKAESHITLYRFSGKAGTIVFGEPAAEISRHLKGPLSIFAGADVDRIFGKTVAAFNPGLIVGNHTTALAAGALVEKDRIGWKIAFAHHFHKF